MQHPAHDSRQGILYLCLPTPLTHAQHLGRTTEDKLFFLLLVFLERTLVALTALRGMIPLACHPCRSSSKHRVLCLKKGSP